MFWDDVHPVILRWVFDVDGDDFAFCSFKVGFKVENWADVMDVTETSYPFADDWSKFNLSVKVGLRNISIRY